MLKTDTSNRILKTDEHGKFNIEPQSLFVAEENNPHLLFTGPSVGYEISMNNGPRSLDDSLAKYIPRAGFFNINSSAGSDTYVLPGMDHMIALKTVTVKDEKNDFYKEAPTKVTGSNRCGDYVCRYNFLDCPIHPHEKDNRPAVAGNSYFVYTNGGSTVNGFTRYMSSHISAGVSIDSVLYLGCSAKQFTDVLRIDGINYSREFYVDDYSKNNPPEPQYRSTLFWKNLCLINSKKETVLSFYTGDITGKFRIIVQGLAGTDVVCNSGTIEVKKE